jgi:hypothetical protein
MACYEMDYALQRLCNPIDFTEIEHDFVPLLKMANEVEKPYQELEIIETRLKNAAGQDFIMTTLQSVAAGLLSPEEAGRCIRPRLIRGQIQKAEPTQQHQYAC